jgi:hypothetical protein
MSDNDQEPMTGLSYKPHFGVECSCGEACTVEIGEKQLEVARKDPVLALRLLSSENQTAIADFWTKHSEQGHTLDPILVELAPLEAEA